MKKIIALLVCSMTASLAVAKLPPLTPEQAAVAASAKAKTAHAGTVAAYQLCMVQNTIATRYKTAATSAPAACVQPPPFVAPAVQAAAAPAPAAAPSAAKK